MRILTELPTWGRLAFLLPALILTACPAVVAPLPVPIHNVRVSSSFADANGHPIICDDRTTRLSHAFDYDGELRYFATALVGVETNRRYAGEPESIVSSAGRVEVRYVVMARTAPLAVGGELDGQSIVVEPIPIGATAIVFEVETSAGPRRTFSRGPIPVVDSCRN